MALHARIIKRACNWGWFPNEGLQKRPFLHGYILADSLLRRLEENHFSVKEISFPPASCFRGLQRLLEVVLDTRYEYLMEAIVEIAAESGQEYRDAFRDLGRAIEWREEARRSIIRARFYSTRPASSEPEKRQNDLRGMLTAFRDYCRAVFVSLDQLQRVWSRSGDVDRLLLEMYDYLFRLYPPRFPAILESTLSEEEIRRARHPALR